MLEKKNFFENNINYLKIKEIQKLNLQGNEIEKLVDKAKKIVEEPLNLAVLGEFNAGKSSFINKILGVDILPVGILPKTATITKLKYGEKGKIQILYQEKNGKLLIKEFEGYKKLEELQKAKDINDKEISQEILSIKEIIVYINNPILKRFTFIDTPGFNHDEKMDQKTKSILREVDFVVWISDSSQVGKKTEIERLKEIKKYVENIYLVINKSDLIINNEEKFNDVKNEIIKLLSKNNFLEFFINKENIPFISSKLNLNTFWQSKFDLFLANFTKEVLEKDIFFSQHRLNFIIQQIASLVEEEKREIEKFLKFFQLKVKNNDKENLEKLNISKFFIPKVKKVVIEEIKKLARDEDSLPYIKFKYAQRYAYEYLLVENFANIRNKIKKIHTYFFSLVKEAFRKKLNSLEEFITNSKFSDLEITKNFVKKLEFLKEFPSNSEIEATQLQTLGVINFAISYWDDTLEILADHIGEIVEKYYFYDLEFSYKKIFYNDFYMKEINKLVKFFENRQILLNKILKVLNSSIKEQSF